MKLFYDIAIQYVKSRIFSPKDYFERAKKRLVRSMIIPLFVLVGAPSIIVSALSSFQYISFQGQGVLLQLVGEASNDVLMLSTTVGLGFVFALSSNLLYSFRLRKTEEQLKSLEERHQLDSAFETLKATYGQYLDCKKYNEAVALGSFICRAYPEHARLQPDFIKSLVDHGVRPDLLSDSPRDHMILRIPSRNGTVAE